MLLKDGMSIVTSVAAAYSDALMPMRSYRQMPRGLRLVIVPYLSGQLRRRKVGNKCIRIMYKGVAGDLWHETDGWALSEA